MSLSARVDELVSKGYDTGRAIAQAIAEKAASVAATEYIAHGGH